MASISGDLCRPENLDWVWSVCPKTCGGDSDVAKPGAALANGSWKWDAADLWNCSGLGIWVRSNVTVGNGAEADMVAMLDEQGRMVLARKLELIRPSPLGIDPDRSIDAAAEVVDAIAMAAGGSG